jgi:phenylpropionate dioxygenase-like ring-hydroxylating dioxygenase large terminal subunit
MFINFWYAAAASTELADKPLKRRMLGQDFVLFRDTRGVAHCLANTCAHRGGSLGDGKVKGDCIQCPYHGWQFDGDGHCLRIPSLGPNAKIPGRTRIDAYPTVERYGLVFAFLGDLPESERPPLMEIPEWDREGWRSTMQSFEWEIDYKRSIENGIDPAHNEFVHPTHGFSYENEATYKVNPLKLEETQWGSGFFSTIFVPPLADKTMAEASGRAGPGTIYVGTGHHGISSLWTFINPTPTMHIYQYLYETPVDETHARLYLINMRNFLLEPENDERMMGRNQYVTFQDRDILLEVRPKVTPSMPNRELFMPADLCVGRYRQFLAAWENRGWRIDCERVARDQMRVAYAIPSPARREVKGWVLDAIPLVPSGKAGAEGQRESA